MDKQDDEWVGRVGAWDAQATGFSMLRVTLLFGSIAIAIAMLAVPLLQNGIRQSSLEGQAAGLDTMSTGSVRNGGRYVMRRSVLQPSPDSVCIIRESGARSGSC